LTFCLEEAEPLSSKAPLVAEKDEGAKERRSEGMEDRALNEVEGVAYKKPLLKTSRLCRTPPPVN